MSKTAQVPDMDVLGDFAIAAAKNARRLLDDAELLANRGRWPLAYSVAGSLSRKQGSPGSPSSA
jgi:hypothetical protein